MKTIIAGGRDIDDPKVLAAALLACPWSGEITEVVSGKARGVDTLGEKWANSKGLPIKAFPAEWDAYRQAAGPMRNRLMAEYAGALIAIWDEQSKGTADMIEKARARNLRLFVWSTVTQSEWKPATQGVLL